MPFCQSCGASNPPEYRVCFRCNFAMPTASKVEAIASNYQNRPVPLQPPVMIHPPPNVSGQMIHQASKCPQCSSYAAPYVTKQTTTAGIVLAVTLGVLALPSIIFFFPCGVIFAILAVVFPLTLRKDSFFCRGCNHRLG